MVQDWQQKSQQGIKKLCTRISNSFSPYITSMWANGIHRYEHLHMYLQKRGISIALASLGTVATYVLKNVEHGIEHDTEKAYGVSID